MNLNQKPPSKALFPSIKQNTQTSIKSQIERKSSIKNNKMRQNSISKPEINEEKAKNIQNSEKTTRNNNEKSKNIQIPSVKPKVCQHIKEKSKIEKNPVKNEKLHKNKNKQVSTFSRMNYHILKIICEFAVCDIRDLFKISYVNRFFHNLLYNFHPELWMRLLGKCDNKIMIPKEQNELIKLVIQTQKTKIWLFYEDLLKKIKKCFEPQANTLNTPNKLLKKLDFFLEMRVCYEKQEVLKTKKLTLNLDNFNSNFICELKEINDLDLSVTKYGNLKIDLKFVTKTISKKFDFLLEIPSQQLFSESNHKNSIFNTFYRSPCLLYFFPDDSRILNCILSISAMTLLYRLQNYLENAMKIIKTPNSIKTSKNKQMSLNLNIDITRFSQETDFSLFIKLHDKKTAFFNFFDTKAFPVVLDKKEAFFLMKTKEELTNEICVKLVDGLGMHQIMKNSCFFDLIFKDSNGFITVISDFIIFEEIELEEKNGIHENFEVEIENFKGFRAEVETKEFKFTALIVKDFLKKRNILEELCFTVKFN